ncbi:hypothetical protein C1646_758119 [Rhizophagus diaphanus]|nr:hypothetical protein C1646_758119 [Rhizophagus diaphanus] [Rhizophagus sp. MUCL 43196]
MRVSVKYNKLKIDNNNFPKQDNSDDSYEKNNNMISMNSSETLQFDISQLNTNKDDQDSKSKGKEKILPFAILVIKSLYFIFFSPL